MVTVAKAPKTAPKSTPKSTPEGPASPLLPNDRDESIDGAAGAPRKVIKQAYQDLQRGLVDTDMHGERGVEKAVGPGAKSKAQK